MSERKEWEEEERLKHIVHEHSKASEKKWWISFFLRIMLHIERKQQQIEDFEAKETTQLATWNFSYASMCLRHSF